MTQTAQRYKVLERIDAGGMAEVFKGTVTTIQGFEKLVAIKRILPNLTEDGRFVRMFLDEARIGLHLTHTNIVQTFDIGNASGTYFIVMEFVDGLNLKNVLNRVLQSGRSVPTEMAVYIAMEVCKGLSHAHELATPDGEPLGIVHRDISPPNILVSREGEVKITDFGLAKAAIQVETTDPGVVKGKFGYLSPEAAQGEPVDLRSDIFALGIILWEIIAGRRLFLGRTDIETLEHVRMAEVPLLTTIKDDVPARLQEIILRALARDKNHRYRSAREFGSTLADYLFSQGRSVTSYDLARLVTDLIENPPQPAQENQPGDNPKVIDILIQNEMDRFISVEEMDDLNQLNLVGAEPLIIEDFDADSHGNLSTFGFEDPRTWSPPSIDEEGSLEFAVGHPARAARVRTLPAAVPNTPHLPTRPEAPPEEHATPPGTPPVLWMVFIAMLLLLLSGLVYLVASLATG
jgi:serine/threonine-protein kinase